MTWTGFRVASPWVIAPWGHRCELQPLKTSVAHEHPDSGAEAATAVGRPAARGPRPGWDGSGARTSVWARVCACVGAAASAPTSAAHPHAPGACRSLPCAPGPRGRHAGWTAESWLEKSPQWGSWQGPRWAGEGNWGRPCKEGAPHPACSLTPDQCSLHRDPLSTPRTLRMEDSSERGRSSLP